MNNSAILLDHDLSLRELRPGILAETLETNEWAARRLRSVPNEGADTPVWLALDAPPLLCGAFVKERRVIPW